MTDHHGKVYILTVRLANEEMTGLVYLPVFCIITGYTYNCSLIYYEEYGSMSVKTIAKGILKKCFNIGPETLDDYRRRGVKIGDNVALVDCRLDYTHGYLISIGSNVGMSNVTLLTHDASVKFLKGALDHSKIGRIDIGNNVFIGYGSIVLPGTVIEDNVLIGAGSVVKGRVASGSVMAGNPLRYICSTDEYMEKNRDRFKRSPVYNTVFPYVSREEMDKMYDELDGVTGFDL